MSTLNVLFIQAQRNFGADAAVHAHIMRYLDRAEFAVHVACAAEDDDGKPPALVELEKIPDIRLQQVTFAPTLFRRSRAEVLSAVRRGAEFPRDFVALRNYVAKEKIAIVHASDRPRSSVYAVALSKLSSARSVVHMHIKWSPEYGLASRWAVAQSDAVLGISRYVTESVVANGKPRERVHTVLNGIDLSPWRQDIDRNLVRAEFGIRETTPLVVSVSRLFPWKGQRELIRALAMVSREVPDATLLVVGADEPAAYAGSFTAELRTLARDLGVGARVIFAGPRSDIPAVMAAADVFALPSYEEPFGLVFLEAMAMGRPVVALSNGGTPEVVEHERTGLLSAAGDVKELAAHLARLLRDPGLRAAMGAAGRARVLADFGAQRLARDVGVAYRRVLGMT